MSFSSMTDQQKADIAAIIAGIRARNGDDPETTSTPPTPPVGPVHTAPESQNEFIQMLRRRTEHEREKRWAESLTTPAAGPKCGRLDDAAPLPEMTALDTIESETPRSTPQPAASVDAITPPRPEDILADEDEAAPQTPLPALPVAPSLVEIDADDAETENGVDFSKSDVGDLDIHMNPTEWSKTLHEYPRHRRHSRDADDWDQNEGFPTPLMRAGADAPEEGQVPSPQAALPPAALEGNIAVDEMRADADDAETEIGVTSPSQRPHNAMPDAARLAYASVQIYHNTEPSRGQAEWVVKIRSASSEDFAANPEDPRLREHYIKLSPGGPRRLSALIKDWIKKRALTEEFLARFEEVTRHLNRGALMGLVSKSAVVGPKRAQGQSSNARLVHDDQFATLLLNADKTGPKRLVIWLADGQDPITITDWKVPDRRNASGEVRDGKAAAFYAYYDPSNIGLGTRQEAKALARYNAHQAELKEFHPMNAVSKLFMEIGKPLADRLLAMEAENEALRVRLDVLEAVIKRAGLG